MTALDPTVYYNPDTLHFPKLAQFAAHGRITPEELYLILDWKASRARKRHRDRLVDIGHGSFKRATKMLAVDLRRAPDPKQRLKLLMNDKKWSFRLPTASAILAVLCPEEFTVYDTRVCSTLGDFDRLSDRKWSTNLWKEYQRFMNAVRKKAPRRLRSFRDCDRWLWGTNKRTEMLAELREAH
jgi:hypothetical protein